MMAANRGYHQCVSSLVANGADVNMVMEVSRCYWLVFLHAALIVHSYQRGLTILMMAVKQGHHECVSILAANGANVNKTVRHQLIAVLC